MAQDEDDAGRPTSKVPSGRLSRFLQISATAGRMAVGGVAEKARRAAQKVEQEGLSHVLLTRKNAELLAARLSRLRGAAMKVGQMLSLEGDNMIPQEFAGALEILRSSAHRMPKEQVQAVLRQELGDYEAKFGSLDLTPMAAASIGQVHPGTTREGELLAIKIQYPGVAESIDSDVDNLRSLLSLARLLPGEIDVDGLSDEVKRELHREVDYDRELERLLAYRAALGQRKDIYVPRVYPELSSARVLSMERVSGQELLSWVETATQTERNDVGRKLWELFFRELFEMKLMQTDPNPANYLFDAELGRLVLLDFGATRDVPDEIAELYRRAFIALAKRDRTEIAALLDDLGARPREGSPALDLLVDLALEVSEALEPKIFDFRETDLAERIRARGRALARYQRDLKSPPPELIFFQRKLGGTFLLCRKLGAQVDVHSLLVENGLLEAPSSSRKRASSDGAEPP